jgi:acyl carrier protein
MLLTVVSEEFGTELPFDDLDQFGSYTDILRYLDRHI